MTEQCIDTYIAELDLFMLNANVQQADKADVFVWLTKQGVPVTISTRLEQIWNITKTISGEIIQLGKIIVLKIIEFCKEHPNAILGMLIGAAAGALVGMVPLIGPILAPLVTAASLLYGGIVGTKADNPHVTNSFEALIILAKDFFNLFADILMVLKNELFN